MANRQQKPTRLFQVNPDYPESQGLVLWVTAAGEVGPSVPALDRSLFGRRLNYTGGGPGIVGDAKIGRVWMGNGTTNYGLTFSVPTLASGVPHAMSA